MSVTINGTNGLTFNDASTQNTAATGFGFKNRIINGDMRIDQRNAGSSVTANNVYTLDRWAALNSQASKYTVQQNAGSVTPPAGFTKYLGITSSSAYSVNSTDYFFVLQPIEGFNIADLAWGTANASAVTLSFKVYSSLTGTFGGSIKNSGGARSYPFSYTVSSANTWTSVSVTIPGDTTGTWATDNTTGLQLCFGLGSGSTRLGTANTWASANYDAPTGSVSVVGTNGATFYITGVQLEKGSTATSFDCRPYGTELALCQRYAWVPDGNASISGVGVNANTVAQHFVMPVQMRSAPTAAVITSGSYTISDDYTGDPSAASATISAYSASKNAIRVNIDGFSGLTTGRFYAGLPGGGWTSRFLFNSEL